MDRKVRGAGTVKSARACEHREAGRGAALEEAEMRPKAGSEVLAIKR
jgi:hypothetical protein